MAMSQQKLEELIRNTNALTAGSWNEVASINPSIGLQNWGAPVTVHVEFLTPGTLPLYLMLCTV